MKLLMVCNNMHIGGVQKSLRDLLCEVGAIYDVTLLLFSDSGGYMQTLPDNVSVITTKSHYRYIGMTKNDVKSVTDKFFRAFYAGITRVFGRNLALAIMSFTQKKIKGYDVAVSTLHSGGEKVFYGGCNEFVLRHTDAPKKITFLHCDFKAIGADTPQNKKRYCAFDAVAACSDGCKKRFLEVYPEFSDKTFTVTNFHDFGSIKKSAQNSLQKFEKDRINIITLARLGREKGVARAVRVIANTPALHNKIRYHIVGDGIERAEILKIIDEYSLYDTVVMHGEISSPYGFLKAADVLLIPSLSEAAPLVIDEAASLGVPIISTVTSSSEEMITEKGFGILCENSETGLKNALVSLAESETVINDLKRAIENKTFDNSRALSQFINIIESQLSPSTKERKIKNG